MSEIRQETDGEFARRARSVADLLIASGGFHAEVGKLLVMSIQNHRAALISICGTARHSGNDAGIEHARGLLKELSEALGARQ